MSTLPSHPLAAGHLAIDLNQPGSFVHWSIFNVSVANLVLIAVMVVIFGVALVLPFPKAKIYPPEQSVIDPATGETLPAGAAARAGIVSAADPEDAKMWTARVRRRALALLPPGKLLPDRQPGYVASWAYVFGVASLAALGVAIASGFALALGGPDWWHYSPWGHFFNSLHLWSVELFMALIVIHLWAKFWMAAWRGRRAMTWITGVVAFIASIIECFTGYLSQSNFDSQWISTSGKDAFNAVGVGSFFNVLNFGQMLMWHIVLVPIILVAIVGGHVLLVRMRGVAHPIDATPRGRRRSRKQIAAADAAPWRGPTRRYDILKEGTVASVVVLALTFGLAGLLSSPDVPSITINTWARVSPADFLATAASELNGTSLTGGYGPPYNTNGTPQSLWFAPADILGVRKHIDPAQDFVIGPLTTFARVNPATAAPLAAWNAASPAQQLKWANAYAAVVPKVRFVNGNPVVPAANDGPVPALLTNELTIARSGALDADLLAGRTFYGTDYTRPLLFIADGAYFSNQAQAMNLTGSQWGVMNETGSYPGQPWLWLYTLWYQIHAFGSSSNADLIAIYLTGLATILLLAVPFIPGLRDIPRLIPVYRLVWRSWSHPGPEASAAADTVGSGTKST